MTPAEIAAQLTQADRDATRDQIERLRLAARRMRTDADALHRAADRNDRAADALAALAALGRTRAYDAHTPRRCTWDSADGGPPR